MSHVIYIREMMGGDYDEVTALRYSQFGHSCLVSDRRGWDDN